MQPVTSDDELGRLLAAGVGFIYNDYPGTDKLGRPYRILHAAGCETLGVAIAERKYFAEDLNEAIAWLRRTRGEEGIGWRRCKECEP